MNGTPRALWILVFAAAGCAGGQANARYGSVIVTSDEPPPSCQKIDRVSVFAEGNGMREIQAVTSQKGGNVAVIDSRVVESAYIAGGQGYQLHLVGRAFKCPPEVVEASRATGE
jgi:hypothetical protein